LGAELRRYREAAGFTIEQVAERLDCSSSKISRLETAQTGASPRDVRDMLALYQVGEREMDDLMEVARETRKRGWWQSFGSIVTGPFVGFEAAAQSVRSYEAQCVPGLLQIEEYIRHMVMAGCPVPSADEANDRVRLRLARQELLVQDEPVEFHAIVDEAALRRPVGGRDVMRRQLEHLVSVSELPNITLQVLPFSAGAHVGMDGSFVLLGFPEGDPDTVYVGTATGGVFQDKTEQLERYTTVFEALVEISLDPAESIAFMARIAKEQI
jgi:transcriptional regulator with XRE-family HTH domain